MNVERQTLLDAIDRFGADLAAWPDAELARAARMAAADGEIGAALQVARDLDGALERARADVDAEVAAAGSAETVKAWVLEATGQVPRRRLRWAAIAAALVLAAALGGLYELSLPQRQGGAAVEVVVLDPIIFDGGAIDR
jgi:hypothetical protein